MILKKYLDTRYCIPVPGNTFGNGTYVLRQFFTYTRSSRKSVPIRGSGRSVPLLGSVASTQLAGNLPCTTVIRVNALAQAAGADTGIVL